MLDILGKGWIGTITGLIGIFLAYYFYRKSLRLPEPRITFKSDHAITWAESQELPAGVKVSFNDKNVPRVARSVVRIWNNGTGCLTKELISEHDNLRFTLENGGEFLAAKLLKESNPASRCNVEIDNNQLSVAHVTFDYLNQNDGMVIGLLHTDINAKPLIKGSMKGYTFKVSEESYLRKYHGSKKWLVPAMRSWLPILFGLSSIVLGLLNPEQTQKLKFWLNLTQTACPVKPMPYLFRTFVVLVGVSYVIIGASYYWSRRRAYPKALKLNVDK